jgi:cell division transport system permease protein
MLDLRTDLPLGGDSATGFIPWLVALMVFLGILAISGVNIFDTILSGWSRSITGTLTVQIPALPIDAEDSINTARTERVVAVLEDLPAVESVRVLTGSEMDALLAPWLGEGASTSELPLPALIDVTLVSGAPSSMNDLRNTLVAIVPDAVVDDHRRWFEHLIELTNGFRLLALGVAMVVAVALALTVVYATRASMAEFGEIIAIFHFIGAQDKYVAAQFAKRTLLAAFKGSVGGFLGGTATLLSIGWLARNVESGLLPDVSLGWMFWVSLPAVALMAALLAMVTAYVTVLSTLRTMM